jgi:carbamoyl-phosphate synthase large subunit
MIGANTAAIRKAEDRKEFKESMLRIGLDVPRGEIVHNMEGAGSSR